jgi:hypothetical protein
MTTYKQCLETNDFIDLIEWELRYGKAPRRSKAKGLGSDIEAFVSPIDGTVVTGRASLRQHNEKHGVTNIGDYEAGHFEKRGKEMKAECLGTTAEAKKERQQLIDKTLTAHGV